MIKTLLGATLVCTAALTTEAPTPPLRLGAWTMYCESGATTCEVVRTLRDPDDSKLRLRLGFVRHADGFRLWVRTPKLADPTVRMTFDIGVTVKLPEPECGEATCRIGLNINADQTRLVKEARVATFWLMLPGKPVKWDVDLENLTQALEKLPRDP